MIYPPHPPVRVVSPADLLAVVPGLLGFHPGRSLVVIGIGPPRDRIKMVFRYDLPDPLDNRHARDIAAHAAGTLAKRRIGHAVAVGYGPGQLVTPVADALIDQLTAIGVELHDVLRTEHGRYWSYLCANPACCPAEGVAFDDIAHPAAAEMAAAGQTALPDRAALAATIAPPAGKVAEPIRAAASRAEIRARQLLAAAPDGTTTRRLLTAEGLSAVSEALRAYRDGRSITSDDQIAWLALTLESRPVRDDAWARMDPAHCCDHRRLWTDVTRRAHPRYAPAPASLLAFTAWQSGDGALANVALDRALETDPDYSMALLLREAVNSALPPSAAALPTTPEEVAASYAAYLGEIPSAGAV